LPVFTVSMIGSKDLMPPPHSTSIAHDRIEAGTSPRSRSPSTVRLNDRSSCSISTPRDSNRPSIRYSDGSCVFVA